MGISGAPAGGAHMVFYSYPVVLAHYVRFTTASDPSALRVAAAQEAFNVRSTSITHELAR
jgi:hypothetical protein